jgi:nocardicin N-oxygenase
LTAQPGSGGCPHFPFPVPADPLDVSAPHRRLQETAPLAKVVLPPGQADREAWFVTGHAEALRVYRDAETFERRSADGVAPFLAAYPVIVALDGEHHRRVRGLVQNGFAHSRVQRLRPAIEDVAAALVDEMVLAGEPADLGDAFAVPLTLQVIARMFDLPKGDYERFRAWADTLATADVSTQAQAQEAMQAMVGYAAALLPERAADPGEDLLSLVAVNAREAGVDDFEAALLVASLVVAGWESTPAALVSSVHRLLITDDGGGRSLYARLCDEPALIPTAVEEMLRIVPNSVLGATNPRRATRDVELGGVLVRAGELCIPSPDSAGRDPAVFDDPGGIDLARSPNPHLAFGNGPHVCVGAPAARMELQVALETLTARLPALRLAVPAGDLTWPFDRGVARRPASYPVAWTPGP